MINHEGISVPDLLMHLIQDLHNGSSVSEDGFTKVRLFHNTFRSEAGLRSCALFILPSD